MISGIVQGLIASAVTFLFINIVKLPYNYAEDNRELDFLKFSLKRGLAFFFMGLPVLILQLRIYDLPTGVNLLNFQGQDIFTLIASLIAYFPKVAPMLTALLTPTFLVIYFRFLVEKAEITLANELKDDFEISTQDLMNPRHTLRHKKYMELGLKEDQIRKKVIDSYTSVLFALPLAGLIPLSIVGSVFFPVGVSDTVFYSVMFEVVFFWFFAALTLGLLEKDIATFLRQTISVMQADSARENMEKMLKSM